MNQDSANNANHASSAAYTGRFAPSPTGLLHAGSLVAALASWLDARAHGGRWLLRIEDVDGPRCVPGADRAIVAQLAACGLRPDEPPQWQSQRQHLYERALQRLQEAALAYPCACTRRAIADWHAAHGSAPVRGAAAVYPGLCRPERGGLRGQGARAWRLHVGRCAALPDAKRAEWPERPVDTALAATKPVAKEGTAPLRWHDRRLGWQQQDVAGEVGDFVLRRADGLWAYQLAVVVDDAEQGVTHVVRGQDLADNTPRQILLQAALGLPTPLYLHTPLVLGPGGEKLSKQNGATALALDTPAQALAALDAAARALGLPATQATQVADALAGWVRAWRALPWFLGD